MAIERFRGDHFYLSNMSELSVPILAPTGIYVPTSEHAYQSSKFVNPGIRRNIALLATGKETKTISRKFQAEGAVIRANWEDIKVGVMHAIVRDKFSANLDIAEMLIDTGDEELVEGNTWGDRFWGVDPVGSRDGRNELGKILMSVRDELKLQDK